MKILVLFLSFLLYTAPVFCDHARQLADHKHHHSRHCSTKIVRAHHTTTQFLSHCPRKTKTRTITTRPVVLSLTTSHTTTTTTTTTSTTDVTTTTFIDLTSTTTTTTTPTTTTTTIFTDTATTTTTTLGDSVFTPAAFAVQAAHSPKPHVICKVRRHRNDKNPPCRHKHCVKTVTCYPTAYVACPTVTKTKTCYSTKQSTIHRTDVITSTSTESFSSTSVTTTSTTSLSIVTETSISTSTSVSTTSTSTKTITVTPTATAVHTLLAPCPASGVDSHLYDTSATVVASENPPNPPGAPSRLSFTVAGKTTLSGQVVYISGDKVQLTSKNQGVEFGMIQSTVICSSGSICIADPVTVTFDTPQDKPAPLITDIYTYKAEYIGVEGQQLGCQLLTVTFS